MHRVVIIACLVLAAFLRCASVPKAQVSDDEIVFFVVGSGSTGEALSSASVSLIGHNGIRLLGRTDETGKFRVDINKLRGGDKWALLFCTKNFFCGAIRLDDPEFFRYRERLIVLAPYSYL